MVLTVVFSPVAAIAQLTNSRPVTLEAALRVAVYGLVCGLLGGGPAVMIEARARRLRTSPRRAGALVGAVMAVALVVVLAQGVYAGGAWQGGPQGGFGALARAAAQLATTPSLFVGGMLGTMTAVALSFACLTVPRLARRSVPGQILVAGASQVGWAIALGTGAVLLMAFEGDAFAKEGGFDRLARTPVFGSALMFSLQALGMMLLLTVPTALLGPPLFALAERVAPPPTGDAPPPVARSPADQTG